MLQKPIIHLPTIYHAWTIFENSIEVIEYSSTMFNSQRTIDPPQKYLEENWPPPKIVEIAPPQKSTNFQQKALDSTKFLT